MEMFCVYMTTLVCNDGTYHFLSELNSTWNNEKSCFTSGILGIKLIKRKDALER